MKTINFSVINLGCSKNLVDTEFIIGEILKTNTLCHSGKILPSLNEGEIKRELQKSNTKNTLPKFNFFDNPEDKKVKYVIINTCGFLSTARAEAEDMMEYLDTIGKKIILIGCYIPVKDDEFLMSLKNLVAIIPYKLLHHFDKKQNLGGYTKSTSKQKNFDISKMFTQNIQDFKKDKLQKYLKSIGGDQIKNTAHIFGTESVRALLKAEKGYEYLKISEGCNNKCSFCIIPNIRGKQKSRPIEDILKEVEIMINSGIKEIEIIAQDATRYGIDIYKEPKLLELLEKIDKIPGDFKYRLFYMYPDILTFKHIERLGKLKKLLPYFDIPFQHISSEILKRMGRFYDEEDIYKMIDYIKTIFKNPFFHTNFIIGFPGETEKDFEELLDFVEKIKFDSVSVFGYHDEILASSSKLNNKVSEKIIIERVKRLKKVLNEIYKMKDKKQKIKVKVGFIEEIFDDYVMIREEIKAPEVDELDKVKFEEILEGNVEVGEKVKYRK